MPRISIIMAAYNSAGTVGDTVNSVLSQDFEDFELIAVNDGSNDGTKEILERLAERDNRVKVINQKNAGPGAARNAGLAAAKGEYVMIIDSDDELCAGALKELYKCAKNGAQLVAGGYIMKGEGFEKRFSMGSFETFNRSSFLSLLPDFVESHLAYVTWNKLYSHSLIKENNIKFTNYRSCEDRLFNLEFYKRITRFACVEKPVYIYNVKIKDGLNNAFLEDRKASLDEFYESICSLYENKLPQKAQIVFANAYIKGVYAGIISTFNQDIDISNARIKEYIKEFISGENAKKAAKKAKGLAMMLPALCVRLGFVTPCRLCARLINAAQGRFYGLFMKLKHGRT